ncbi:hypothetical protein ACFQ4C_21590 [Larkinella insperata]|uniref:Uncharacterized protein n=1 Tax=Larkinella insperata TaxID=332158 RepID=A0ABW3QHF6_9BACT
MHEKLNAKNLVQFRLTGTPEGNLLVSFYHLDVFNQDAVNWHIAGLFAENRLGKHVLYEGNLQNNTHYPTAILKLLDRVNGYVNCVRIERVN